MPSWVYASTTEDEVAVVCRPTGEWFRDREPQPLPISCSEILERDIHKTPLERVEAAARRVELVLQLPRQFQDNLIMYVPERSHAEEDAEESSATQLAFWRLWKTLASDVRASRNTRKGFVWRLFPGAAEAAGGFPPGESIYPVKRWGDPLSLNGGFRALPPEERLELLRLEGSLWMDGAPLHHPGITPEPELRRYAIDLSAEVSADPCQLIFGSGCRFRGDRPEDVICPRR